jgi:hypothetical protein
MPGLEPGIHVFAAAEDVDGEPGHDEFKCRCVSALSRDKKLSVVL